MKPSKTATKRKRKTITVDVIHRERVEFRLGMEVRDQKNFRKVTIVQFGDGKAIVRHRWFEMKRTDYYEIEWSCLRPIDGRNYA